MLALMVEYLTGRATATDHTHYRIPEWPPHPARLFYALVATHHETSSEQELPPEQQLLQWLERQAAPEVYASRASTRGSSDKKERELATTHFVPVNDANGEKEEGLPEKRSRQARQFPSVTLQVPHVIFHYPHAQLPMNLRVPLTQLLSRVTYLGHSHSLISVRWEEDSAALIPQLAVLEAWRPDQANGQAWMRVPTAGLLLALETEFARTHPPDLPPVQEPTRRSRSPRETVPSYAPRGLLPARELCYRRPSQDPPSPEVVYGPFAELVIFRPLEGPRLSLEAFPHCTRVLRKAALYHAATPNPMLSGHQESGEPMSRPHVSYLPLPDVGHPYAKGRIMGLAVALPRQLTTLERRGILGALAGIDHLTFGRAGAWAVERLVDDPELQGLQPETWSRPTRDWATVTPIVLDRFPKTGDLYGDEAQAYVSRACQHVGLPLPIQVAIAPVSELLGVPHARNFPQLKLGNRGRLLHVHAHLRFEQPVGGPLLIGSGRYHGYGLLRPLGGT